jgi:uncharacterized protein YbjT (DUF2867 family)
LTRAAPRVLVTGATGRLGTLLVPRLVTRGVVVRALTRDAERASAFHAQGIEAAIGDFTDAAALRRALRDVTHVFLLSPITPMLASDQIAVIEAAARAGVERIVKLSGSHWTIEPAGRSLSGDAHASVEAALRRSGLSHRVLRPNAWMQVMLASLGPDLVTGDVLYAPPAPAPVAWIDARDIADVAVEALLAPVDGAATVATSPPVTDAPAPWVLTGARAVGWDELAAIASRLTGRAITTAPLPEALRRQREAARPPSPHLARVHAEFAGLIAAGAAAPVTDTIATVLGRAPRDVEAFLAERLAA